LWPQEPHPAPGFVRAYRFCRWPIVFDERRYKTVTSLVLRWQQWFSLFAKRMMEMLIDQFRYVAQLL